MHIRNSAAVSPVPCSFRTTMAAGGSISGMNTHSELAAGQRCLHEKAASSAKSLIAPMHPPGPVFGLHSDLLGPSDFPIFENQCGVAKGHDQG